MKRNYKILMLVLLLAFASCSFTTKTFNDPDRDKMLIQIITYVLERGHFDPKIMDDEFSAQVYQDYIENLDPLKRYFHESDIEDFDEYKFEIDDQLKNYDISFFSLTHERLLQRMEEAEEIQKAIIEKPFDFSIEEVYNSDYEKLPYVRNKKQMKERWRQQLKYNTLSNYHEKLEDEQSTFKKIAKFNENQSFEKKSLEDIEKEAREATARSFEEYFDFIEDRERKDYFAVYLNSIVEEFDPHTSYYPPQEKDRFDVQMKGSFEGIGARLEKRMDNTKIVDIISGGPVWRQNQIEVGDIILKVRQEDEEEAVSIVGMRLDDAIKLIKGPKGTKVILTMKRMDGTIEDIEIVRDVVELEETYAKSSKVEKDGKTFGIINLPKFYVDFNDYKKRNAASDIEKEIERLKAEGMEGLVLDLRNNGGGSLQTVVDMAGLFIKEGPVVQVKSTTEPKEVLRDKDKSIAWDGPLVILVNELSASASEILAAAMQDYKRAIVIGSKQTYGKGTVQNFIDLNRMVRNNKGADMGALKLTTQKYYRINGGSTQLEGVKSDVIVPDRYSFIDVGEKDQENPLPWDQIEPASFSVWNNYFDYESTIKKSKERMADNEQLKLIEESAKWVKKVRDVNDHSLNYEAYKARIELNEQEAQRFEPISDYQTDLTFKSLPYEIELVEKDTVLREKRKRWHLSLSKDVYVEEALNVLNDLKLTYGIRKVAEVKD
ncbi:MAG: carboxy terminal-processing peptidase [Bacteroidia bacterium]|nr:carboxy terminal-processing peptidase [Bacteroidia bacterium]MBT8309987.1 carboxy terminal-processing peptidase [Bacteroidia bacterium]NND10538.1 carboxy terminal-processing peptidase [Flavobacteriaceae bacterium]NNK27571.1 carboxy terminal-processing peptidase [Flavobacteriaceae bacterium]NNL61677.1 carboxy terminal-processing peptidase [Flavobacteriaceae bacterium]